MSEQIPKSEATKQAATAAAVGTTGGGVFAFFLFDQLKVDDVLTHNIYGPAYALAILCIVAGIVLFGAIFLLPNSTVNNRKWFLGGIVGVFAVLMLGSTFFTLRNAPVTFYTVFEPDISSEAFTADVKLQPIVVEANRETPLTQLVTVSQGGSLTVKLKKLDVLMDHYRTSRADLERLGKQLTGLIRSNSGLQQEIAAICLAPDAREKQLCKAFLDQMSDRSSGSVTDE